MAEINKARRWRVLIDEFEHGDQGATAFCRDHNIPVHQFYYWRTKLAADAAQGQQLVPVMLETLSTGSVSCVRLPNGVEISSLDSDQIKQLLPLLASL